MTERLALATMLFVSTSSFSSSPLDAAPSDPKEPVRVFILVGQSNVQGKGKVAHLESLVADPETTSKSRHLRRGEKWVERDDVWIKYWERQAWGGQSLERDFRPPGAGLPDDARLQQILEQTDQNRQKKNRAKKILTKRKNSPFLTRLANSFALLRGVLIPNF